MYTSKLHAGAEFPVIKANLYQGKFVEIGKPREGCDWKLVIIYRGRHCPLCTKYLNALEKHLADLREIGVDTIAISGDSEEQLQQHLEKLEVSFPLAYGLSQEEMQSLGLYISVPRSEKETDHNFAEPGLFVINAEGKIQVIDISNNPFVRPDLVELVSGLQWIRNPKNSYPIRGTYSG